MLLCALVAGLNFAPALARADGDPASDVLLGENVFYPYQPEVSAPLQKALNAETAAAAKAHFPIKVALIESKIDLGIITQLYGKPEQYAQFLDQEISYPSLQPLLVVMPDGLGTQGLPAAARAVVPSLRAPTGPTSDDLAQAAVAAVKRLATASGHPLDGSAAPGGSGSATPYIAVALVIAALTTAGTLVATRRRAVRRRQRGPIRPAPTPTATRRRRTRGTIR
jgi:hypothetical protein